MTDWTTLPSSERKKAVKRFVSDGMRPKEIAEQFDNCTRNAIIGFCSRNDIALLPAKPTAPRSASNTNGTTPAQLITDNMEKLRAYSLKVGKHNHEEVFQEACATVMAAKTFDPSYEPGPWLYKHVRSAGARILRGQLSHVAVGLTEDWVAPTTPANQEESADLAMFLDRASGLPHRQRQVCELVAQDHTLGEAAAVMGVTRQAAGVHMQKARWALKLAA